MRNSKQILIELLLADKKNNNANFEVPFVEIVDVEVEQVETIGIRNEDAEWQIK